MGAGSYALRATTYKYPGFTFSPPLRLRSGFGAMLSPLKSAVDLGEGDLLFTWQPTWSLSRNNKLGIRGSVGFAGGLFNTKEEELRENYLSSVWILPAGPVPGFSPVMARRPPGIILSMNP